MTPNSAASVPLSPVSRPLAGPGALGQPLALTSPEQVGSWSLRSPMMGPGVSFERLSEKGERRVAGHSLSVTAEAAEAGPAARPHRQRAEAAEGPGQSSDVWVLADRHTSARRPLVRTGH